MSKADKDKLDAGAKDIRKAEREAAVKPQHELEAVEVHPLATLVPEMSAERYAEFRADVKAKGGLTDPIITLYEGKILDGRHRSQVCVELGIPRAFNTYDGTDPAGFILSKNLRRDLSEDQHVQLMTDLRAAQAEAQARERQKAHQFGAKSPNESPSEAPVGLNSARPERTREKIVAELKASGVKASVHKVRQAQAVRKAGLSEEVKTGRMSLNEAAKKAATATPPKAKAKPKRTANEPSFETEVWHWFSRTLKGSRFGKANQQREVKEVLAKLLTTELERVTYKVKRSHDITAAKAKP